MEYIYYRESNDDMFTVMFTRDSQDRCLVCDKLGEYMWVYTEEMLHRLGYILIGTV